MEGITGAFDKFSVFLVIARYVSLGRYLVGMIERTIHTKRIKDVFFHVFTLRKTI
jgi:hypothetical protein